MNKLASFFIFILSVLLLPHHTLAKEQSSAPTVPLNALDGTKISKPFFLMGDGQIKIKNIKSGKTVDVKLLKPDGSIDHAAFFKIDDVFGFPAETKKEHISQRMIFMLDYFSDHFAPGKTIYLKSGYRSPKYNQGLRDQGKTAAKTSTHIDGMAIDFYLDGVNGKEMWEYIRHKECCGVGNYGGNTVHLDSGRPRFWEQETSKVRTGASDFNRFIYLSTEFDKYNSRDTFRLFFTSISDLDFGIKPTITFVTDKDDEEQVLTGRIITPQKTKCLMMNKHEDVRFVYSEIPEKLEPGSYRVRVDFCNRPFEEMPEKIISNIIEVLDSQE